MDQNKEWGLSRVGKTNEEPIGKGWDSKVFQVSNPTKDIDAVAKQYENMKRLGEYSDKIILELLREYYYDTERAKKIIEENSNPLNQNIKIYGEEFSLNYQIISQGSILIKESEKQEDPKRKPGEKLAPISFGQKFIKGADLISLLSGANLGNRELQKIFLRNEELYNLLVSKCQDLFSFLSKRLDVYFLFDSMNIKPFLYEKERKIIVIITDLAGNLDKYFLQSPRLERKNLTNN